MRKFIFVVKSHNIYSYLWECIKKINEEHSDVLIDIYIDDNIQTLDISFNKFVKKIDGKFPLYKKNPLELVDIKEATQPFSTINIKTDKDKLELCDWVIAEKEAYDNILDLKKLTKKGILILSLLKNEVIHNTINNKNIELQILYDNTVDNHLKVFKQELNGVEGIKNGIEKILFNYSIFLNKVINDSDFEDTPSIISKTPRNNVKETLYYVRLLFSIIIRKFKAKELNWKLYFKQNSNTFLLKQPDKSFWADPFIVQRGHDTVVYFEELKNDLGRISAIKVDKEFNVIEKKVILDKDYHLSFPNVFLKNDIYYMIPESSANNNLQLLECNKFPYEWSFKKNLMEDIKLLDAVWVFYDDRYWIFANKIENFEYDNNERLYLYHSKDLFSKDWKAHKSNPIITDASKARNAGNIINENGVLYRVSQNCKNDYGENIVISKIKELSTTNYVEDTDRKIFPSKAFKGMHTMNTHKDLEVFDVLVEE